MAELTTGVTAPDFAALTDSGATVKLSDYLGQKVILYFYPKDDTAGWTIQARGFRESYVAITEKNAIVLGVSPDGQESHQQFREKYDLPFTLLVDADHTISEMYGTWQEKTNYGKTYMGIVRSHFVIDETGVLVDASYNVKPDVSPEAALAAL
jgi:thioredoxin-dependent peroxiredoxin